MPPAQLDVDVRCFGKGSLPETATLSSSRPGAVILSAVGVAGARVPVGPGRSWFTGVAPQNYLDF